MKITNPIKEAVKICGTQYELARRLGIAQPTIVKWIKKGIVPPRKVLLVEKVTGIPRYRLNPLIYPPE